MKHSHIAVILILVLALGTFQIPRAEAAISNWQKSATMQPMSNTDFSSNNFQQSVQKLKNAGANYVTLVIPLYQSNLYSTDINAGWNTPTDASLTSGINYIHSQGMGVMLKIHLESYTGEWRAYINPGDRDTWYRNYTNQILKYARIAQASGVETYCIGSELISMATDTSNPDNTVRWNSIISQTRAVYSGKLTYNSNWGGFWFGDEKNHINFWNNLDYIGVSAYFNLSGDGSVDSLKNAWNNWNNNEIKPLADRWGKPILFTELGYRSVNGAHNQPWDYGYNSWTDMQEQANDYTALFSYWNSYPYMIGVALWDWQTNPNAGGTGDNGYTPQNKPAEAVMKQWFGSSPPPPPPSGGTFTMTGSTNPAAPNINQSTQVQVSVKANSGALSNGLVDIEVYNSGGNKVHQQFFEGQNIANGETKNYVTNWTPNATGNYTIRGGVFSSGWSTNYTWNGNIASFTVNNNNPPPPPPQSGSTTVDVWWPTNGVTVSGIVPFKAAIYTRPVDQYNMFWQVDGDRLNDMFTNMTDYPHKEVLVDLSGWNWKDSGPYTLNFVAKDLAGTTLGQKAVNINVTQ